MRPLDLKVAIQNSYEASRSEAVRLDKPVAASHMANEDAKRDQVHRDQSVTQPPEAQFNDDIFDREKENEPDYTEGRGGHEKNTRREQPRTPEAGAEKEANTNPVETDKGGDSNAGGHFSTYA